MVQKGFENDGFWLHFGSFLTHFGYRSGLISWSFSGPISDLNWGPFWGNFWGPFGGPLGPRFPAKTQGKQRFLEVWGYQFWLRLGSFSKYVLGPIWGSFPLHFGGPFGPPFDQDLGPFWSVLRTFTNWAPPPKENIQKKIINRYYLLD